MYFFLYIAIHLILFVYRSIYKILCTFECFRFGAVAEVYHIYACLYLAREHNTRNSKIMKWLYSSLFQLFLSLSTFSIWSNFFFVFNFVVHFDFIYSFIFHLIFFIIFRFLSLQFGVTYYCIDVVCVGLDLIECGSCNKSDFAFVYSVTLSLKKIAKKYAT